MKLIFTDALFTMRYIAQNKFFQLGWYVRMHYAVYFYLQRVQSYVRDILAQECRPSFARQRMKAEHHSSTPVLEPFLDKNTHLNEQIFQYPSPFGFLDMKNELQDILDLLPASSEERHGGRDCRRCLVIGNGGILKGLGLGPLFNQFDTIIRWESALP